MTVTRGERLILEEEEAAITPPTLEQQYQKLEIIREQLEQHTGELVLVAINHDWDFPIHRKRYSLGIATPPFLTVDGYFFTIHTPRFIHYKGRSDRITAYDHDMVGTFLGLGVQILDKPQTRIDRNRKKVVFLGLELEVVVGDNQVSDYFQTFASEGRIDAYLRNILEGIKKKNIKTYEQLKAPYFDRRLIEVFESLRDQLNPIKLF